MFVPEIQVRLRAGFQIAKIAHPVEQCGSDRLWSSAALFVYC